MSLYNERCLAAEQTLLSKTSDRCSLSSIGLDPAACHLSHLNGPKGDLSVALEHHALLALTQSNARSAFRGRSHGSYWDAPMHTLGQLIWPPAPEPWPSFTSRSPLRQLHLQRVSLDLCTPNRSKKCTDLNHFVFPGNWVSVQLLQAISSMHDIPFACFFLMFKLSYTNGYLY